MVDCNVYFVIYRVLMLKRQNKHKWALSSDLGRNNAWRNFACVG